MTYRNRRIDGRTILSTEDLISPFKLNYNRTISEWEATGRRAPFQAVRNQPDTDEEFEHLLKSVLK